MSRINSNTIILAEELAKLNGNELQLSTRKILIQRYVETCHSINSKNQIHIEFKSNSPISLNPKYVATITKYVETLNVKVYDIHSNLRDRVYVYGYPKKPSSPLAVVKATQPTVNTPSTFPTNSDLTDLEQSPAVKKIQFNGHTHLTPIVFVRQENKDENLNLPVEKETTSSIESTGNKAQGALLSYSSVATNYDSLMYQKTRLTNNDTFNKLRRFLACYTLENLDNNKDLYLFTESESYVSLKTQLMNEGLPSDNKLLRKLYIEFLVEKGFSKEMADKDLEKLKRYYDNSHMIRSNQVKTNFKTYYYGESSAQVRYITEEGMTHKIPGRSAPDVCVVV